MPAEPFIFATGILPHAEYQWDAGGIAPVERSGAHAFFGVRTPFIPSLLGADFTRMVGGNANRAQLIIKRQLRFITDMGTAKDHAATFDLRFILEPATQYGENGRIDLVLLTKVFHENRRQAIRMAQQLAGKLRTHYPSEDPFNYPFEPLGEDEFGAAFEPIPWDRLTADHVLEIRKFEDRDPMLAGSGDVRGYFPHPFSPVFHVSSMGRFIETLAKQRQRCVVSISLRPASLFPGELMAITQLLNNYHMMFAASEAGLKLIREERLADLQRTYAPLINQRNLLFLFKVRVVGEQSAPDEVIEALGSEIMDNDTDEPRLWSKVRPESQAELNDARTNLALLEHRLWGPQIADRRLARLRSLVSAHEAAGAFRLPIPPESGYLPGIPVRDEPFVLPPVVEPAADATVSLGEIMHRGNRTGVPFEIPIRDLTRHLLVAGSTGSGKTNTALHLLSQLWKRHRVPFLVMYPIDKPDYRLLMADADISANLLLFTLGDEATSPFRFNPFAVADGVLLKTHISLLLRCFSAAFVLWDPLPAVFREALREVYAQAGWDVVRGVGGPHAPLPPTLGEFHQAMLQVADRLTKDYGAEARGNVRQGAVIRISDLVNNLSHVLNVRDAGPLDQVLRSPTVFELARAGSSEDVALVMGFLLMTLSEQVQSRFRTTARQLRGGLHVMLIEEAHRLMAASPAGGGGANTADPRARGGEDFSNILAEVRGFNEGIMIAEQIPTSLVQGAVANTHLKIMHWLEDPASYHMFSDIMNLDERQRAYARTLQTGEALVRSKTGHPVHVRVGNYLDALQTESDESIIDDSDAAVAAFMSGRVALPVLEAPPDLSGPPRQPVAGRPRWGALCDDCTAVCMYGDRVAALPADFIKSDAPLLGQFARSRQWDRLDDALDERLQTAGLPDAPAAAYCYFLRIAASRTSDGQTNAERYAFVGEALAAYRGRHGLAPVE